MNLPLSQLLAVGRSPNHTVAVRGGKIIPFAQFQADVGHNAARLKAVHCRIGAPVCRDSYWFMVGFLALCHAGAAIVMPANTQPGTLEAISAECDLLLVDQSIEFSGEFSGAFPIEEGGPGPWRLDAYDPDRVIVDFFTSGSTGSPKKIRRTAHNLECEVSLVTSALAMETNDGLVSGTVPHHHVYGLIFRLLWPLSWGRPFSAITHDAWETLLEELQPGGVLVTSPAHLSRIGGIDALTPAHAPALVLSAGAPLLQKVAIEAADLLGTCPTEIFGSTETGACAIRAREFPDTPWQPLPGVRFGLSQGGTLKIRSPAVPVDGWVETADVVELLSGGGFRFKGRADLIVKIEGKRISLPEVELQLSALSWVDAAAVTMVETADNRLGAVVVLSRTGREVLSELGEFRFGRLLRRELARTQEPAGLPRLWRFVESLPVGEMGKRREKDLAERFLEST